MHLVYKHIGNIEQRDNYFSDNYLQVRQKEGRLYTDEQVALLPEIESSHKYYKEWKIRKRSAERLYAYLLKKEKGLSILEVGCGNGWLSNFLSRLPGSRVIGIDINKYELTQAQRVFGNVQNLTFIYGNPDQFSGTKIFFDVIVFAASIQYFFPLQDIITISLQLLKPGGEIHIIDSNLYKEHQLADARHRSIVYYTALECTEMADYYYHHKLQDLNVFMPKILSGPNLHRRLLGIRYHPFYWIKIGRS